MRWKSREKKRVTVAGPDIFVRLREGCREAPPTKTFTVTPGDPCNIGEPAETIQESLGDAGAKKNLHFRILSFFKENPYRDIFELIIMTSAS